MIVSLILAICITGSALPEDSLGNGETLYREAMALESQNPPDSAGALLLYNQSAQAGYVPAMRYLGYLLYEGKATPRDATQGIEWLKKAADKGDAASWENLGWIYRHGSETERSDILALEAFNRGAQAGRPHSAFELAQMAERGEGAEADTLAAIRYYELALRGGVKEADNALADLTDWRIARLGPDSSLSLAKKYFYGKAPIAGTSILSRLLSWEEILPPAFRAQVKTIMAQALSLGRGVRYDPEQSISLYYQAAAEGDTSAQFVVSELLESYPDALDTLIDNYAADSAEKENQKSSSYWRDLASKSGITNAEEAERRLQSL